MRKRSSLLIFASLLVLWGGCVDTTEPTGPVPDPPEDGGGELTAAVSNDSGAPTSASQRRVGSTQRN